MRPIYLFILSLVILFSCNRVTYRTYRVSKLEPYCISVCDTNGSNCSIENRIKIKITDTLNKVVKTFDVSLNDYNNNVIKEGSNIIVNDNSISKNEDSGIKWTDGTGLLIQLGLCIGTFLLFYQSLKSVRVTEKLFQIENKPYLLVEHTGIDPLTIGVPIRITYSLRNYGKTAAQILSIKRRIEYSNNNPLTVFNYAPGDEVNPAIFVVPEKAIHLNHHRLTPLSALEHYQIMNQQNFIYLHGEIIYKSIYDDKKFLYKFCLLFQQPSGYISTNEYHNEITPLN